MKIYVISASVLVTNFSIVAFITKVTNPYMADNMITMVSFVNI